MHSHAGNLLLVLNQRLAERKDGKGRVLAYEKMSNSYRVANQIREGKEPFIAIVDSGVSRLRPVSMAALTTVLGMIPLLADAFFVSMAVTIMFGLAFATVLTLIVVPVLYAGFFGVRAPHPR